MVEGNDAVMEAFVFYRDQIYIRVWSGFFNESDLEVHLSDLSLDQEAAPHLQRLEIFARIEMASKRRLEATWPARTDWDRLNAVFQGLERANILCLHDAGNSVSDAYGDASDIILRSPERGRRGFAYYQGRILSARSMGGRYSSALMRYRRNPRSSARSGKKSPQLCRQEGSSCAWRAVRRSAPR